MAIERKYDIDNLRWMAILLLFPFHAAQIWSGLVVVGYFVLKFPLSVTGQFLTIILISFVLTFLLYELIKSVLVLRFFLGISKRKGVPAPI